jgi:hypothetical protein
MEQYKNNILLLVGGLLKTTIGFSILTLLVLVLFGVYVAGRLLENFFWRYFYSFFKVLLFIYFFFDFILFGRNTELYRQNFFLYDVYYQKLCKLYFISRFRFFKLIFKVFFFKIWAIFVNFYTYVKLCYYTLILYYKQFKPLLYLKAHFGLNKYFAYRMHIKNGKMFTVDDFAFSYTIRYRMTLIDFRFWSFFLKSLIVLPGLVFCYRIRLYQNVGEFLFSKFGLVFDKWNFLLSDCIKFTEHNSFKTVRDFIFYGYKEHAVFLQKPISLELMGWDLGGITDYSDGWSEPAEFGGSEHQPIYLRTKGRQPISYDFYDEEDPLINVNNLDFFKEDINNLWYGWSDDEEALKYTILEPYEMLPGIRDPECHFSDIESRVLVASEMAHALDILYWTKFLFTHLIFFLYIF